MKFATTLLASDCSVAITRHGDSIGYFIPVRRKRSGARSFRVSIVPSGRLRRDRALARQAKPRLRAVTSEFG